VEDIGCGATLSKGAPTRYYNLSVVCIVVSRRRKTGWHDVCLEGDILAQRQNGEVVVSGSRVVLRMVRPAAHPDLLLPIGLGEVMLPQKNVLGGASISTMGSSKDRSATDQRTATERARIRLSAKKPNLPGIFIL